MAIAQPNARGRRVLIGLSLSLLTAALALAFVWPFVPRAAPPATRPETLTERRDVFRIYVLGESTSEGIPYAERCDFGRIVSFALGGSVGARPIEVVNLAKAGKDAAFCLEQARNIVAWELVPEAAVVLLYCGHNEFLKYDDEHDLSRSERAQRVPLTDSHRIIAHASPGGLPGFSLFWDNCHPTLEGYALIAAGFAEEVARLFDVRLVRAAIDVDELARHLGVDAEFRARAAGRQGQYAYGQSTLVWNPTPRLEHARRLLDGALATLPTDPTILCSLAVLATFEGDMAKARVAWQRAYDVDATLALTHVRNARVRELLRGRGVDDPLTLFAQ